MLQGKALCRGSCLTCKSVHGMISVIFSISKTPVFDGYSFYFLNSLMLTSCCCSLQFDRSSLQSAVPAVVYCLDNNMIPLIVTMIDPATIGALMNLKVATSAFFMYTILGKRFNEAHMAALLLVILGASLTQVTKIHAHVTFERKAIINILGRKLKRRMGIHRHMHTIPQCSQLEARSLCSHALRLALRVCLVRNYSKVVVAMIAFTLQILSCTRSAS